MDLLDSNLEQEVLRPEGRWKSRSPRGGGSVWGMFVGLLVSYIAIYSISIGLERF